MTLITVILTVLVLNIPFGYWRSASRKFGLQWVLAIHLPVPGVVALRVFSGLGWQLYTFPLLIAAFFIGQYLGGRLHAWMITHGRMTATGCLVMDMYRSLQK